MPLSPSLRLRRERLKQQSVSRPRTTTAPAKTPAAAPRVAVPEVEDHVMRHKEQMEQSRRAFRHRNDPYPVTWIGGKPYVTREHLSINFEAMAHVGIIGKLYHRYDRVTPILDSMHSLSCHRSWSAVRALQPSLPSTVGGVPPPAAVEKKKKIPANAVCQECGTTDPNDMEPTADGDAMRCSKCGVVAPGQLTVSMHREKNCTQDEDKTVRAEKPREETKDRFDQTAPSAEEARKAREREAQGVYHSRKEKEKRGLGWAPEYVARMTAQATRNRQEMSPKDQTKENQILQKLDALFATLEPMEGEVKRYCRIKGYCTWQNAVRHAAGCNNSGCQLSICAKGPPVIAESVLLCALANLAHGVDTIDGVSHTHVVALNNKLNGRVNTSSTSAAQRAVRQQVARLMAHDSLEEPLPPCAQRTPASAKPSPVVEAACSPCAPPGVPSGAAADGLLEQMRQGKLRDEAEAEAVGGDGGSEGGSEGGSDGADAEEHSSYILKLRDAISRLRQVLSSTRAPVVHATMTVVANNRCMRQLCGACETDARLQNLNLQAFAFVILETVARRAERAAGGASESGSRMRPRLLQSIGMSADRVEAAVAAANAALPEDVALPGKAAGDDGMAMDDGLF